jgi:hypothetical protein
MDINVYCDESCHLERDGHRAMVLGALSCPKERAREIATRIRELKVKHRLSSRSEIKWNKISPSKEAFYLDLLSYFLTTEDLRFRALIVPDKSKINHAAFDQDHATWYYKMFFLTLKVLIHPADTYNIYLDYRDTQSAERCRTLHKVLCRSIGDHHRRVILKVEPVRSHHVEQIQLADLLTGLVSYVNRGLSTSGAKTKLVKYLRDQSGYDLTSTTPLRSREAKINLLRWEAA